MPSILATGVPGDLLPLYGLTRSPSQPAPHTADRRGPRGWLSPPDLESWTGQRLRPEPVA